MDKVKIRRAIRDELPGIAVIRDATASADGSFPSRPAVLDLDMEADPELQHLLTHDPDGFFTAVDSSETLGFAAAHVRSRQWVLSELWVLQQHRGRGAGEKLLNRVLSYGERSGAREFMAIVPCEPNVQSLLVRHEFKPVVPVYQVTITADSAANLSQALTGLLPGQDVTSALLERRGQADLDRLERLGRGITREVDYSFWLRGRGKHTAFVRQGDRVAGYCFAGNRTVGPMAASTPDAAMATLGWGLHLAEKKSRGADLDLLMPARFESGLLALFDAGARLESTFLMYGRNLNAGFDRSVFGQVNLP
jgi:ribosomal protein S18 acetylase RimI-like enzyme